MTFAELQALAQREIGHRLFTVMRHRGGHNQRVWSSNPEAYPPGGAKKVRETEWTRILLREGRPFIGRDAADISTHFPDAETILALGCESVLNLPILHEGRVLGTVNLLHRAGHYGEAEAERGMRLLAPAALPLLLGDLPSGGS